MLKKPPDAPILSQGTDHAKARIAISVSTAGAEEPAAGTCHEHGYTNYATNDGFCVGAGGKLIKVGG
jgi:hypothetical protein